VAEEQDRLWVDLMPDAYERWLAPTVFQPFALDLAGRAARLRPSRLLELAAGTGVLTRELIGMLPDVELTATDLNPAMVSLGSELVPAACWEQADAGHLKYADSRFELVACQFGVMFFPDKRAAFAETARVLTSGGRLLFNVWDVVNSHGFASALVAGLHRAFPQDPPDFITAVPHGYANREVTVADLAAAGLECVSVQTVTRQGQAASASDVARGFCAGTPLRAGIEARGDLAAVTAIVTEEMTNRLGSGPIRAPMTAHVFEARIQYS
jgi:SAM-dependent methyltransferase